MKETKEQYIANMMKNLGCTKEEAEEAWQYDHEVEAGKVDDSAYLTPEQQKNAKEITGEKKIRKKRAENAPKPRKVNEEKVEIIAKLLETVKSFDENATIVKDEREVAFKIGENSYSVTLTMHRPPKKA